MTSDEPSARLWSAFQEAQLDCWKSVSHPMGECCEKAGLAYALTLASEDERRRIAARLRAIPRSRAVNQAEWEHVQVDAVEDAVWAR